MRDQIAKIYTLLGRIPVSGDSVEVMATVRQELREIHRRLSAPCTNEKTREEDSDG